MESSNIKYFITGLSERRKKIEAANREKELIEKARGENLPTEDIKVDPENVDWLFGEEGGKQPSTAGGDVQENPAESGPCADFGSSAPAADNAEDDNDSTESEIEEFTPSKLLEDQKGESRGGFSVPVSLFSVCKILCVFRVLIGRLRRLLKD